LNNHGQTRFEQFLHLPQCTRSPEDASISAMIKPGIGLVNGLNLQQNDLPALLSRIQTLRHPRRPNICSSTEIMPHLIEAVKH
jgi:hypothetical protein